MPVTHNNIESDNTYIDLTLVAPAHCEEDNVKPMLEEISGVMANLDIRYEMIVVDDGSTDNTLKHLKDLQQTYPWLRILVMRDTPPNTGHGQSAAFKAGFNAARGRLIAVMDADLQNDPADLPAMLKTINETGADMVQGDRSHNRKDNTGRRIGSWIGRTFRKIIIDDSIRDTGCSLRIMKREIALSIPLEFRGVHRFIPATARQLGYKVVEIPVNHRARTSGSPKYGIFNRAIPGLIDCLAIRWMRNRRRPTTADEIIREK